MTGFFGPAAVMEMPREADRAGRTDTTLHMACVAGVPTATAIGCLSLELMEGSLGPLCSGSQWPTVTFS